MALDHAAIGDDFFRRLRGVPDAEIVELTDGHWPVHSAFGRFLHVLEVVRDLCVTLKYPGERSAGARRTISEAICLTCPSPWDWAQRAALME